ncbi:MAG: penicillin-binding protein 2 [Betaproteobacteria bacterium RIFCSPLOWO2_12_FULL_62_58]|nr:MAG: penicillin-binding protein 2 [Betaproteobacteria bacterium RIFCSPLOWO2_02_FULL_62_79]OGA46988.1 MAG: penicillin-binding protein 2 [Betaproteobacteria bacterium RIFCSPLOWO2_12_FULL_62_58]
MSELTINPGVELRNSQLEIHHFRLRLAIVAGFVLTMFSLLFVRFFYLQVIQYEHYHTLAEANRISIVPIVPNRGIISDRNGVILAHNYSAYTLEITPAKVDDLEALINELAEIVDIAPKDRRRFKKLLEESKRFDSLPIRTRLTEEEIARFAANRYRFPGVEVKARLFRQYPQAELFSHVVGHIGRINQRDLDQLEADELLANYRGTDYIGKTGLEQSYERHLHGTTGVEEVEVDSGGRAVRTLLRTPPVSGSNLVLKLDARLQEVIYRAFGDRRGAVVAIEPGTGGVLAFVSKPGFDPNLFVDGIDPQNWNELNNSPDRPMVNRALAGTYPPGSTFKPYMALAALTYGKRTPQQTISDPGYFMFGGHMFRDSRVGGNGVVDMYKSIVVSSDTYYYMLANDLGIDAISRFMAQLGFGSRTGIDLASESAGILPSQEWKMKRFKQKWYAGETISIGIGQGYNAYTPLQLATAIATIANDGVMFRPHLVDFVEDIRTRERTFIEPKPLRTLAVKPEHLAVVKQALVGVNKEGTGRRAFAGAEYVSAGKTGTAQVIALKQGEKYVESRVQERHRDHALFIAYAPADKPKIALAVIVENSGFGARAAAPIARQVLDYYLLGKVPASAVKDDDATPD